MPDTHKEKDLRACINCKLILSQEQWKIRRHDNLGCINCGNQRELKHTPYFSGTISLFLPSASWVARWNGLEGRKPGVYALNIYYDDYYEGESDDVEDI